MVLQLEGLSPSYLSGPFADGAVYPGELGVGSRGGPVYNTAIHETRTGEDYRISRWGRPQRVWSAQYGLRNFETIAKFLSFYRARTGAYEGFRFRDPFDWTTAPNGIISPDPDNQWSHRCLIGASNGVDTQFQLLKTYQHSNYQRPRPITHPIAPNQDGHFAHIYVGGVLQVEGTSYTLDYTTGIVTFAAPALAGSQIEWGGTFHVPARFGIEIDERYLATVGGTDAWELGQVPIVEIAQDAVWVDRRHPGGVWKSVIDTDYQISLGAGRLQMIRPTNNDATVYLPSVSLHPLGGDILTITNTSVDFLFKLADFDGTIIQTAVTPGEVIELWLRRNP